MSGIFGVMTSGNCREDLFYGIDYHSHLGTQFGGMAVWGDDGSPQEKIRDIEDSQFKSKFASDLPMFRGSYGIGVISGEYPQPLSFTSQFGPFCLCYDGRITNKDALVEEFIKRHVSFSQVTGDTINDTELLAKLVSCGDTVVEGIEYLFDKIEGSVSLLVMNRDGIYAARDREGRSPLAIGRGEKGWAVATETSSFPNLGYRTEKVLGPAEIVLIGKEGLEVRSGPRETNRICAFLWVYTGFPASDYEGINAELVRERCGMYLAKRDEIKPDIVTGVPDSGIAHAIGYAIGSGCPYRRPLLKYTPGYGRSYTPPSQRKRDHVATLKLIPNRTVIEGNSIVLCEDSIVRGTQLKNFTIKKLWDNGAREVHIRVASPPLMYPCIYNVSTRTTSELAARKAIRALEGEDIRDISKYLDPDTDEYAKMVEWLKKDHNVTTLNYQRLSDLIAAIGLPKERLCLHCWIGDRQPPD